MWRKVLAGIGIALGTLATQPAFSQAADVATLLGRAEHVGIMRHAAAPGFDDPPNFRLGDCATQRNLSAGGRAQAAAIGRQLRAQGLASVRVVSSQWCRCRDTAELLELGRVEELPYINSLVSYPREAEQMTRDARAWLLAQDLSGPTLLVTHQVNIGALVGVYPDEGEIVVVRRTGSGDLEVVGSFVIDSP